MLIWDLTDAGKVLSAENLSDALKICNEREIPVPSILKSFERREKLASKQLAEVQGDIECYKKSLEEVQLQLRKERERLSVIELDRSKSDAATHESGAYVIRGLRLTYSSFTCTISVNR